MRTRGSADRLLTFFAERSEPCDDLASGLAGVKGRIELQGIAFAYPQRPPVLKDFDLTIARQAQPWRIGSWSSTDWRSVECLAHL